MGLGDANGEHGEAGLRRIVAAVVEVEELVDELRPLAEIGHVLPQQRAVRSEGVEQHQLEVVAVQQLLDAVSAELGDDDRPLGTEDEHQLGPVADLLVAQHPGLGRIHEPKVLGGWAVDLARLELLDLGHIHEPQVAECHRSSTTHCDGCELQDRPPRALSLLSGALCLGP